MFLRGPDEGPFCFREGRTPRGADGQAVPQTEEGRALEQKLEHVPEALACQINRKKSVITQKEAERMKKELYRIIEALND